MNAVPATRPAAAANPFADAPIAARPGAGSGAVAQTDQHRAIAEVQAAMMIARANPRDPISAMDRILNACTRQSLAESALYSYSRGGTDITGPSIRLAEAIAQQWGNVQFGIRELEQASSMSTVQAYAWDVETNVRREVTFQVPLMRHTRKGSYKLEDPRDIYEMVANQGARRLRACILAVIPGDVVEAAVRQCELTLHAKADTSPEAIASLVKSFAACDVTKAQIEKRIQRRLDAIQPAQIVALRKIYVSLRDGMSAPADWFEVVEQQADSDAAGKAAKKGTAGLKERLKDVQKPGKADAGAQDAGVLQDAEDPVRHALEAAEDVDQLDAAADLIRNQPPDQQDALRELYGRRRDELDPRPL